MPGQSGPTCPSTTAVQLGLMAAAHFGKDFFDEPTAQRLDRRYALGRLLRQ